MLEVIDGRRGSSSDVGCSAIHSSFFIISLSHDCVIGIASELFYISSQLVCWPWLGHWRIAVDRIFFVSWHYYPCDGHYIITSPGNDMGWLCPWDNNEADVFDLGWSFPFNNECVFIWDFYFEYANGSLGGLDLELDPHFYPWMSFFLMLHPLFVFPVGIDRHALSVGLLITDADPGMPPLTLSYLVYGSRLCR